MLPVSTQFTRTRIAPTPSGFLHLGNAFSFALSAALARKTGARILLRIDDLDVARVREAYVQDIFDTLQFLQIPWDEGPVDYYDYKAGHSQLHRMELYKKALEQLKKSGHIFACSCSRSQLALKAENGKYPGTCRGKNISPGTPNVAWRLRTNVFDRLTILTGIENRTEFTLPDSMNDFVVRKKDGFPAYQLASLIDDQHFSVDLVVRGQDLWPSTLAQLYLARMLQIDSFSNTTFVHHPLLMQSGHQKLSKSAGSSSIRHLRMEGKTAEDIYGMIGEMTNCTGPVYSWESLGDHILPAIYRPADKEE